MSEGLKKGWTKVAFGDVVRQVKDKVEPELSGLERYVAGEHMDTDDLKIRRWGTIGDGYLGPAFHMRFKPGHVLYGSRRTYLRKVAVPDFEGITANTTYVLEAKDPKILMQEFLPFIMQTEGFHEHSIKQSKGSVNPYINFSDLTWYEFALPPLEEQELIANLLNKINKCAQSHQELSVGIELILNTYICKSIIGEQEGDLVYDDRFGYHAKHFKLNAIGELIEQAPRRGGRKGRRTRSGAGAEVDPEPVAAYGRHEYPSQVRPGGRPGDARAPTGGGDPDLRRARREARHRGRQENRLAGKKGLNYRAASRYNSLEYTSETRCKSNEHGLRLALRLLTWNVE